MTSVMPARSVRSFSFRHAAPNPLSSRAATNRARPASIFLMHPRFHVESVPCVRVADAELLLPWSKDQLRLAGLCRQFLDPAPDSLQRATQSFRAVLKPAREIVIFLANVFQGRIITRPILPIKFVDRKNVMVVETAPIKFPQTQHSAGPSVAVGKWVNRFKLVMHDGRTENRRNFCRIVVPPPQQVGHHRLHPLRRAARHNHPRAHGSPGIRRPSPGPSPCRP